MEKDVDPQETNSFDQMNLISLVAKRPKTNDELEEMIQAIKTIAASSGGEESEKISKLSIETLKFAMQNQGETM